MRQLEASKRSTLSGAGQYGAAVALVLGATAVGFAARGHLAAPDHVMLYLLAIGVTAARSGRPQAIVAAACSVLAYDFVFVEPYYTFAVSNPRHLLTFAMMFVVGLVTSALTRLSESARTASLRARTEEMRSSLLSSVSHDLRTPLAVITGAATTLRAELPVGTPSHRAELLDTICEEAERLERLVRNLLDMTRIDGGAVVVNREWVPLEELVGSALARVEKQIEGRPVGIHLPTDSPFVFVDPLLLEQLLVNLLENAARHTPSGSPVDVLARCEHEQLTIEIADRGRGVAPEDRERIFGKFARRAPAGVRGAGLGLAICRGIAEAHGGAIGVDGRPGGGALFRLVLPTGGAPPLVPPEPDLDPAEPDPDRLQTAAQERTA